MHTRETERDPASLGTSAKGVAEHASALARLALELKRKVAALGIGIGLALGAALLLVYALGFGLAAIAAGLATAMSTWAALLIVSVGVLLVAALLGFFGLRSIKKGAPPVPEQALREAKLTSEALKGNGRH